MIKYLRAFDGLTLSSRGCNKSLRINEKEKKLTYGDSIYYLNEKDYFINPVHPRSGVYESFPDNLNIDPDNGRIFITLKDIEGKASQIGLKYKIYFNSLDGGIKDSTEIVLGGINYQDRILEVAQQDSILYPNLQNTGPDKNRFFNFVSADKKLIVDEASGAINLLSSTRNGFFGDRPVNQDWKQVRIFYEDINYPKVRHEIELVIYFYTEMREVPSNVSEVMRAHQALLVDIPRVSIPATSAPIDKSISGIVSAIKPRPPCIILVGK